MERSPREFRGKKKSGLSRLVQNRNRLSDHEASPRSARYDEDRDGSSSSRRPKYPIDADVQVTRNTSSGEDSDEGIGMSANNYRNNNNLARARPTPDRQTNRYKSNVMDSEEDSQGSDEVKDEKRYRRMDSSESEEEEDRRNVPNGKNRRFSKERSPDEDSDNEMERLKEELRNHSGWNTNLVSRKRQEKEKYSNYTDSNKLSRSNHEMEDEEEADLYDEPTYSSRSLSKKKSSSLEELPKPDKKLYDSKFGTHSASPGTLRRRLTNEEQDEDDGLVMGSKHLDPDDHLSPLKSATPRMSNTRTSNSLRASFEQSWSHVSRGGQTSGIFDTMSQRSVQSSSVLTTMTVTDVKRRSYLVGGMTSASSLMGQDELERYFPDHKMKVYVGSWNMNEVKYPPDCPDEFLLPDIAEIVQDFYIIGTQESTPNRREWEIKLQESLGPQYVLFHSAAHGVLYLSVFMRRDLVWYCSVSEEDQISTRSGPSGIKTKGAVAVCFTFFGTSFLFVNTHLTPHSGKAKERCDDIKKICAGLKLPKVVTQYRNQESVTDKFDCVFWCGDLNFRLLKEKERVERAMKGKDQDEVPNYDDLVEHDELYQCKNRGEIFEGFQEGRITFKPTFKYKVGTNEFNQKVERIPSYTDRILFKGKKKGGIQCLQYGSIQSLTSSDHKPVYGIFDVQLRPGRDNIPPAAGQFDREVWLEGIQRRNSTKPSKNEKSSSVCSIQ